MIVIDSAEMVTAIQKDSGVNVTYGDQDGKE